VVHIKNFLSDHIGERNYMLSVKDKVKDAKEICGMLLQKSRDMANQIQSALQAMNRLEECCAQNLPIIQTTITSLSNPEEFISQNSFKKPQN